MNKEIIRLLFVILSICALLAFCVVFVQYLGGYGDCKLPTEQALCDQKCKEKYGNSS